MKLRRLISSAFVIGRRDFSATVVSKAFLFFLMAPLFPVLMGVAFGGLGARIESADRPVVAVVSSEVDFVWLSAARERLAGAMQESPVIGLSHASPEADTAAQRRQLLGQEEPPVLGVLEGGLDRPHLIGAVHEGGRTIHQLQVMIDDARQLKAGAGQVRRPLVVTITDRSAGSVSSLRLVTAYAGQSLIFFLTLLLAGMVLSQLIEEKSNKVIEILAAAVPVDAIFLGKVFAMLAISMVGIAVWTAAGTAAIAIWTDAGLSGLPSPAIGWPAFLVLVLVYFAMSYLLMGAVFLGIGAQASTVREVQTLSMPVTMAQVVIFGFAAMGVGRPDSAEAIAAAVFPLSSPFAMLGRAAEEAALWPHLLALLWQALWVAVILHVAAGLFRRSVLKSGPTFRWPWQRGHRRTA